MAKKELSGVQAKGTDRIQFDFRIAGVRYRPTVERTPSTANLRRAEIQLKGIKARIKNGTFVFEEEFPDYRYKDDVAKGPSAVPKTCSDVFDKFLGDCETRVAMDDMAWSTLDGYRKTIEGLWRPKIGKDPFEQVVYSRLAEIASAHTKKKKTYNNVVSVLRTAFRFGYKDHPGKFNPALGLPTFRITKKERPPVDPFTVQDAETIIASSHAMFGEAHGNYEEFGFFTGLRQSEQIALRTIDCDLAQGVIRIVQVRIKGRDKNRTKTNQDREIQLSPRALQVLRCQFALREELVAAGEIDHDFVFFWYDGSQIRSCFPPYKLWVRVMDTLPAIRYRPPVQPATFAHQLAAHDWSQSFAGRTGGWAQRDHHGENLRGLDQGRQG